MDLKQIKGMPTVINNTHESCYRSYTMLKFVLEMVERGDSRETIKAVVDLLNSQDINGNFIF